MHPGDDLDRAMAVMADAFDPHYREAWTRRQVEDALTTGNCHLHLVDAQGATIEEGVVAAGFSLSRQGYDEEELLLIAVSPQYRRKGIGRSILEALAVAARTRGSKRLLLEMRRGNPAESLYRAFGFSVIGERKDYYRTATGDRIDAITFACEIGGWN
jgi:ribosomal-protein-alanine N-acetyltransferase